METLDSASSLDTLRETRRTNLRKLAGVRGAKQLAIELGWSPSQLTQIIGPNPTRNATETVAHHVESKLGLAKGWLDQETVQ